MAWISTPHAPAGERWFHKIDHENETLGIWHLGSVPRGKTWPAAKARCGYEQIDIKVGGHETAASIGTQEDLICAECLRSVREQLERERAR